jgi:Ribonuclease HI
MQAQQSFEIYTDGSLKEGRGSWAYVILQNGEVVKEAFGKSRKTTCNRMEFQAAIEAFKVLPVKSKVQMFTDSRNLIDTVTIWMSEWKQYDWVKKNQRPIPAVDLVKQLDFWNSEHEISWKWVRAHAGNEWNERCDQLCIAARTGP